MNSNSNNNKIDLKTHTDFYAIVREMIKDYCSQSKEPDISINAYLMRRIIWERAKGELTSMIYTYGNQESESRIKMITAIEDYITVIENYLEFEQNKIPTID